MQWEGEGGWRGVCPVDELAATMDDFSRLSSEDYATLSDWAREGALYFDWDNLVEKHWLPFLQEIAQ